jgi:hypothetical protein
MGDWLLENYYGPGGGGDGVDLRALAAALGGTVAHKQVNCTGPNGSRLVLTFSAPDDFYVYDCSGCKLREAEAWVAEKLNLPPPDLGRTAEALAIWNAAQTAAGSLVQMYLRSRCLTACPDVLRFAPALYNSVHRQELPCMVALVTDGNNNPIGIHRTWLMGDGSGRLNRKTRGQISDGTVRLCPAAEEMAFGEGLETSLAYMQLTGVPTWSALNAVGLRLLTPPSEAKRIILLADNKSATDPGPSACRAAHRRLASLGWRVRIAYAPHGMDFNDVLVAKEKEND